MTPNKTQLIKTNTKAFVASAVSMGVLLAAVIAPQISSAAGKAAPAATGSVGYSAYGLQRYADFDAHVTGACTPANLSGAYVFTLSYGGGTYVHTYDITPTSATTFTGTGSVNSETLTGSVTDGTFSFTSTYSNAYAYTVNGTVGGGGALTVTDWSSTQGQTGGSWSATGQAVSSCPGKGTFNYSDVNGSWYTVNVQYVQVKGDQAWFAGPVVSGNTGAGQWLFASVTDGGTPGRNGDMVSGSFTTEAVAVQGVASMDTPADSGFPVTSGNLVVHNR